MLPLSSLVRLSEIENVDGTPGFVVRPSKATYAYTHMIYIFCKYYITCRTHAIFFSWFYIFSFLVYYSNEENSKIVYNGKPNKPTEIVHPFVVPTRRIGIFQSSLTREGRSQKFKFFGRRYRRRLMTAGTMTLGEGRVWRDTKNKNKEERI